MVSPLHFSPKLIEPKIRPEYARLDQLLEESGPVNPYECAMFQQPQELSEEEEWLDSLDGRHDCMMVEGANMMNMTDWSIISTQVHYSCHPSSTLPDLMVLSSPEKSLEDWHRAEGPPPLLDLPSSPGLDHYLDQYDEVCCVLHVQKTFHDNRDVSTTYLGTDNMLLDEESPHELTFPIYSNSRTWGQLVGGSMIDILFDTGASKCYMSRSFYERNEQLHSIPKMTTHITSLTVGNGQMVKTLFVIPIVIKILFHKFEIYALVAEIQDKIDLVFGMKNMFEVEGELSCRHSEFRFLNRAAPLFPTETFSLKPGQKRFVKVRAKFLQHLTGDAIVKIVHGTKVLTLQIKLHDSLGMLDFVNTSSTETLYCEKNKCLGVVDIRSLGYFNIRHLTLKYSIAQSSAQYMRAASVGKHDLAALQHSHGKPGKQTSAEQHAKHARSGKQTGPADEFPWLDPADPRRNMTDEEILDQCIKLEESTLSEQEKKQFMNMLYRYREAFSLRDEIGHCPNITVDIDVIDDSPFFVRPFPISETDKPIMDRQMKRLVSLGILSRNTTSHTSPVMLITRKVTQDKRPVVDFRLLNTRIRRQNTATPLLRDIHQILGKSGSDTLSCVDIRDAFHSLKLSDKAKDMCGIMPYFGSPHYRYEVMPMGLCISPCKWIEYITVVMESLPDKTKYIAIMDDILVHSKKKKHTERVEDLLKALISHGLKLSPKKCQFFRNELVYMGNVFKIKGKRFIISPIKTRIDALLNTPEPKTPKECKSFCGVVNYLSLFCPNLQSHLAPIYDLTRKGRPFIWTDLHQTAFDTVKSLMAKPPLLHLPDGTGRFILCSDTSKSHAGSALWQIQGGKPRLLGYSSKKLPEACKNYSITELELTGMLYNLHLWKWYILNVDIDVCVDHRAIPFILKSKDLPTTERIRRLLWELRRFTFHCYYIKGKDMILADFFSRTGCDHDDPEEIIPIAFELMQFLEPVSFSPDVALNALCQDGEFPDELAVMTRARAAAAGAKVPPVHGAVKGVNPLLKPETQAHRAAAAKTPKQVKFQTPAAKTPAKPAKPSLPTPGIKTPSATPYFTPAQSVPKPV